eukprot:5798477-Karenia_brevis.AAC.1
MDDEDHVLANVALPNLSMPASSSNSGQPQPSTAPPATASDPIQQFDPWQQGGAKKRAFGGSPTSPAPPSVTQEELAMGLNNLGQKLSAGFQKAMADVNIMVSGNIQD